MKNAKETKRERFVRVAEARTSKAISMIWLLGNCSNTAVYQYSGKDIRMIFDALEDSVSEAKRRFKEAPIGTVEAFTLN